MFATKRALGLAPTAQPLIGGATSVRSWKPGTAPAAVTPLSNESAGMAEPVRYRTAKADVCGHVSELLAKATKERALDGELTERDGDFGEWVAQGVTQGSDV
jgi:monoamine oxidase